jgi:hypothetical protein
MPRVATPLVDRDPVLLAVFSGNHQRLVFAPAIFVHIAIQCRAITGRNGLRPGWVDIPENFRSAFILQHEKIRCDGRLVPPVVNDDFQVHAAQVAAFETQNLFDTGIHDNGDFEHGSPQNIKHSFHMFHDTPLFLRHQSTLASAPAILSMA